MHDRQRTANLLGATGLAVADLALGSAFRAAGVSASGAAALIALSASGDLSVTELGRRIGLSQSAAARMVDSLELGGLAVRQAGKGKAVPVRLTRDGARTARELLAARGNTLTEAIAELDDDEQHVFAELLGKVLTRLYQDVGSADLMCRLCDRAGCTVKAPCPVGAAERNRGN